MQHTLYHEGKIKCLRIRREWILAMPWSGYQFIFFISEIQLIPTTLLASQDCYMDQWKKKRGGGFINHKVLYKYKVTSSSSSSSLWHLFKSLFFRSKKQISISVNFKIFKRKKKMCSFCILSWTCYISKANPVRSTYKQLYENVLKKQKTVSIIDRNSCIWYFLSESLKQFRNTNFRWMSVECQM